MWAKGKLERSEPWRQYLAAIDSGKSRFDHYDTKEIDPSSLFGWVFYTQNGVTMEDSSKGSRPRVLDYEDATPKIMAIKQPEGSQMLQR